MKDTVEPFEPLTTIVRACSDGGDSSKAFGEPQYIPVNSVAREYDVTQRGRVGLNVKVAAKTFPKLCFINATEVELALPTFVNRANYVRGSLQSGYQSAQGGGKALRKNHAEQIEDDTYVSTHLTGPTGR